MLMPGDPPGRLRLPARLAAGFVTVAAALCAFPSPGFAALGIGAEVLDRAPVQAPADSADLRSEARRAQRRFERTRVHYSDWNFGVSGGMRCDDRVGRLCLRHGRGSTWEPPEEAEEVREARHELLDELARIGREIPGDDWVLGQRIKYLGEADRWEEAEGLARRCGGASEWWCRALLGYVLHEREEFPAAAQVFREALEAMDPERAAEWTDPSMLADPRGASLLSDASGEDRSRLEERFWMMADPLFLVEGNDRRTAHLTRWVAATMGEDARNPYAISWSDDLAEVTVRYGRTIAWQKDEPPLGHLGPQPVVGRRNPRSRGFVPSGEHLERPAAIPPGEWTTDDPATEEQYAPPYSPRIEGMEPQVAVFPRGDSLAVVAAWQLPDWVEYEGAAPEPPPEGPFEAGLFLVPLDAPGWDPSGETEGFERWAREVDRHSSRVPEAGERDVLRLDVPRGDYLLSLEALHVEEERAWRARQGLTLEEPEGPGAALSDILLLEAGGEDEPKELDELLPQALPGDEVPTESEVGVAWEVRGAVGQVVEMRLTLEGTDRSLMRRLGERLRLTEPEAPTVLGWSEQAPEDQDPFLRTVDLDLAGLDPGSYELVLEVEGDGGEVRRVRRALTLGEDG